ncbi:histidine kinase [Amorphoplanes nipponensis]|uniref:histidine kinase n=1 Tax=Actinoplanes nipponensis TaxID=135950 RepID=A0A919MPP6_9ACTN|nr:histidine kinase [Actinoplanes nipponensis]GIE52821.1 two-component sensor histidine kinase [Actinoplanes nipponensis]
MELGEVRETRFWRAVRRHPQLSDAALALPLVVPAIVVVTVGGPGEQPRMLGLTDLVAGVIAFGVVTVRRRFTRTGLVVAALAWLVAVVGQHERQPVLMVALVLLSFTHAARSDRRTAWLTAGCLAAALYLSGVLWAGGSWWAPENLGALAWIGMATAVGDATRSRRAYVAEVEERARRAEQSRDEEARRRVVEERLRIARELHDVVAHHIAVIKVQASGAKHILPHRPERVGPALDHISRSSDAVLQEIASVVGLLRGPGERDAGAAPDTEPTRGLARLSALLDDLAAAGLRVDHRQLGAARELPALVDLAAFRIAQEALTNAQKYGDGTARLAVSYTADGVTLEITNPVRPDAPASGSGYGIVGMRERATSTGGALSAGPTPNGHFTVHAQLPTAPQPAGDRAAGVPQAGGRAVCHRPAGPVAEPGAARRVAS